MATHQLVQPRLQSVALVECTLATLQLVGPPRDYCRGGAEGKVYAAHIALNEPRASTLELRSTALR